MMNEANDRPVIKLATTDFMDEHYATCQEARCWFCNTYQRIDPINYEAAIIRHRTKGN